MLDAIAVRRYNSGPGVIDCEWLVASLFLNLSARYFLNQAMC